MPICEIDDEELLLSINQVLGLAGEDIRDVLLRLLEDVLIPDPRSAFRAGKFIIGLRIDRLRFERNLAYLANDRKTFHGDETPSAGDAPMVMGGGGIGNDSAPVSC